MQPSSSAVESDAATEHIQCGSTLEADVAITSIDDVVSKLVLSELEKRMARYEAVVKAFGKYFDQGMIDNILDAKVEQRDLDKVAETKANKPEIENVLNLLLLLDKKLRHMSVL